MTEQSDLSKIAMWARRLRGAEPISIGWNCSTAHYLRSSGVRHAAYPFDWTFSSPSIVTDAIERRFSDFIDPAQLTSLVGSNGAGHQRYHRAMFAHAHPTISPQVKAAYQRRIQRFLEKFYGTDSISFVAMVLPEADKRSGWSEGFSQDFALPSATNLDDQYRRLSELASERLGATFFVFIRQRTEQAERNVILAESTDIMILIDFCGKGDGGGLKFNDFEDDVLCRRLYAALFSS